MVRPRTILAAQLVSIVAAGAIAWTSITQPELAWQVLGLAYILLGLLTMGAVWHHLRSGSDAPRCHRCGNRRDRFRSLPFCHACGHRQDPGRSRA